jgi:hypothetical protein
MPGPARNFLCPATEAPCVDPSCRRDLCRTTQRENEAYSRSQVARGKIEPADQPAPISRRYVSYSRSGRRRRVPNREANEKAIMFGILVIGLGFLFWLLKLAIRHGY